MLFDFQPILSAKVKKALTTDELPFGPFLGEFRVRRSLFEYPRAFASYMLHDLVVVHIFGCKHLEAVKAY
ncbi:hypothetical protein A8B81_15015 [Sulfitobacter pontiacus]|nr:hypothetical protein A8B81_15015 [Sulfitobacter pontiacus]